MKQITQGEMAELKRLLAIVGLDVKRKPKPKPKLKADGLTIWAKRRIARAYKGSSILDCGKHGDWQFRDIGLPFLVRLWNDRTIEPRFDADAIARLVKHAQPKRKLLTYEGRK